MRREYVRFIFNIYLNRWCDIIELQLSLGQVAQAVMCPICDNFEKKYEKVLVLLQSFQTGFKMKKVYCQELCFMNPFKIKQISLSEEDCRMKGKI